MVQVWVFQGILVGGIDIIVSWTVYTALVSDIFYNTEGAERHGKYQSYCYDHYLCSGHWPNYFLLPGQAAWASGQSIFLMSMVCNCIQNCWWKQMLMKCSENLCYLMKFPGVILWFYSILMYFVKFHFQYTKCKISFVKFQLDFCCVNFCHFGWWQWRKVKFLISQLPISDNWSLCHVPYHKNNQSFLQLSHPPGFKLIVTAVYRINRNLWLIMVLGIKMI